MRINVFKRKKSANVHSLFSFYFISIRVICCICLHCYLSCPCHFEFAHILKSMYIRKHKPKSISWHGKERIQDENHSDHESSNIGTYSSFSLCFRFFLFFSLLRSLRWFHLKSVEHLNKRSLTLRFVYV